MKNKTIVLAGGAGFIGQALAARWGKENRVIILSRSSGDGRVSAGGSHGVSYRHWDGRTAGGRADMSDSGWVAAIEGCDLVVNLAGRSVNCRYNARNRQEIFDSRTDATAVLAEAIRRTVTPPKLWVNVTSATIYRHAEDRAQDEYTGEIGQGFSVDVCKRWEECFFSQRTPFTRKIALRTAIVLGDGGVMKPYRRLVRWGLGGRQGNGWQRFSWVHADDIGGAIDWLFERPELEGVYNMSAPEPVTNAFFMKTLRRLTGSRIGLPSPAWLLKIGAWVIGTETELLLKSRWVVPTKLLEAGFRFRHERLEPALAEILNKMRTKL